MRYLYDVNDVIDMSTTVNKEFNATLLSDVCWQESFILNSYPVPSYHGLKALGTRVSFICDRSGKRIGICGSGTRISMLGRQYSCWCQNWESDGTCGALWSSSRSWFVFGRVIRVWCRINLPHCLQERDKKINMGVM